MEAPETFTREEVAHIFDWRVGAWFYTQRSAEYRRLPRRVWEFDYDTGTLKTDDCWIQIAELRAFCPV